MRNRVVLFSLIALAVCLASAQTSTPANVFPVQEGFVDSHGALIYYMSGGRGAPLMIIHGGPGESHEYFLPHLLPLMRTNRLVFIDERGSGKSSKLEDATQYTVSNMVEDIEAVRQALGLGRISLLGHSFGGPLVEAYAFKYQKNLSHLILASTFASTKELNAKLAKMKSEMPAQERERLEALEAAGLFGQGTLWALHRGVRQAGVGHRLLSLYLSEPS
jgi:proline iminopeptidase